MRRHGSLWLAAAAIVVLIAAGAFALKQPASGEVVVAPSSSPPL